MQSNPSRKQVAYQHSVVGVIASARAVMRRHGLHGSVAVDEGTLTMLPPSADHRVTIATGASVKHARISADWFHDPGRYRHAIESAVDAALAG